MRIRLFLLLLPLLLRISCVPVPAASIYPINIGAAGNDGTGDTLRSAFGKVNTNFTTLNTAIGTISASSATNLAPTNLSFGVFFKLTNGVFQFFNIKPGTNTVIYTDGSNIVINATGTASGGGGIPSLSGIGTNTTLKKLTLPDAVTNSASWWFEGTNQSPRWTNMSGQIVLVDRSDEPILTLRYDNPPNRTAKWGSAGPLGPLSHEFLMKSFIEGNANGALMINFDDINTWFLHELNLQNRPGGIIFSNSTALDYLAFGDTNNVTAAQGKTLALMGTAGVGISGPTFFTNAVTMKGSMLMGTNGSVDIGDFVNVFQVTINNPVHQRGQWLMDDGGQSLQIKNGAFINLQNAGAGPSVLNIGVQGSGGDKIQVGTGFYVVWLNGTDNQEAFRYRFDNQVPSNKVQRLIEVLNLLSNQRQTNQTFAGMTIAGLPQTNRVLFVNAHGDPTNVTSASPSTDFVHADGTPGVPTGSGDVVGPGSASDKAVARFNGGTGKTLQNSAMTVDDNGVTTADSFKATNGVWVGTVPKQLSGSGSPEGAIAANVGSAFYCTNGCTGSGMYVKTNGSSSTGWWLVNGSSAGLSDGDKGDITVSGGGLTFTIDNGVVTFVKMQNIATDRLVGRDTAGTGSPEELTVGGGLEFTGSGGIQRSALSGDVAASAGSGTTTIGAGTVTLAKMANLATDTLIGRDTAGTGVPEALTVGGGLEFTGSGGIQRSALSGDITASAGSGTTVIANNAVTYAKQQDVSSTQRVIGRNTAGAGDPEEVGITSLLDWISATRGGILFRNNGTWTNLAPGTAGQFLQTGGAGADVSWVTPGTLTDGDKGDITVSGSGGNWQLDPQSVGPVEFRDSVALSVVGRSANSGGSVGDMAASADGQVMRRSGTSIGFGAVDLSSVNAITGTLIRANMPSATAFEDEPNTFGSQQTFQGPFAMTASTITASDIDWSLACFRRKTLTGNTTFTFSNLADDRRVYVELTQDGTGGRTVTWPAGITWYNSTNQVDAPSMTPGAGAVMLFYFYRQNGTVRGAASGPDSIALTDLANITGWTKGDLAVWSGTHFVRQLVGPDGQVLRADSTSSNGVAWSASGAGIIQVQTNGNIVGNQTNINILAAQGISVVASNNTAGNKIDLIIDARQVPAVQISGSPTSQQIDFSLSSRYVVTNMLNTNQTYWLTNFADGRPMVMEVPGNNLGTNFEITVSVVAGGTTTTNIKWLSSTNVLGNITAQSNATYYLAFACDSTPTATNIMASWSTTTGNPPRGSILQVAGGYSATNAVVGGLFFYDGTAYTDCCSGNITTNAGAILVKGNMLTNAGDGIHFLFSGTVTNVAGNLTNTWLLKYGTETFLDTGFRPGTSNTFWTITGSVTRRGLSAQRVEAVVNCGYTTNNYVANTTQANGADVTLQLVMGSRRQAATTNDLVKAWFDPVSR